MKASWIRWPLAAGLFASACGSPEHGATTAEAPKLHRPVTEQPAGAAVGLKVQSKTGELKSIWLPPIREGKALPGAISPLAASFGRGTPASAGAPGADRNGATPGVKPQADLTVGDETVSDDPGWWLIAGAAAECGMFSGENPERPEIAFPPVVPPWSPGSWFIFQHEPASCDELTLFSETLLCIAEKLETVATTAVPVRWEKVQNISYELLSTWGVPEGAWIVPPQSEANRFIALDQARFLLGYAVAMDVMNHGQPESCSEQYAAVIANPQNAEAMSVALFGAAFGYAPVYPSLSATRLGAVISIDNVADLAAERLLVKTHVLRAASRMLETNVRTSVMSDLASAERGRGIATDLIGGNRAAWGLNADASINPYNTYGHALRVLEGRVELGGLGEAFADPACGGIGATEVVSVANGNATESRVTTPKVATAAQQDATCLMEGLGIVVPSADVSNVGAVRLAIADQAVAVAAQRVGIVPGGAEYELFKDGTTAQLARNQIAKISDGDVLFALGQTRATFALLTNQFEPGIEGGCYGLAGLTCAEHQEETLDAVTGIAIEGGLPKGDLAIPIKARAAKLSAAAQCEQSKLGAVTTAETPLETLSADAMTSGVLQNPFALGQTIAKRLTVIREALSSTPSPIASRATETAMAAIAETRAWAGHMQIAARQVDAGSGQPGNIQVAIAGLRPDDVLAGADPADFPSQDISDWEASLLANQFVVVWGTAEVADCVSGLRRSCPELGALNVGATAVLTSLRDDPVLRQDLGMDGVVVTLELDPDTVVPGGVGEEIERPSNSLSDKLLYVIQKHDPTSPTAHGKVLAAFSLKSLGETSFAEVSELKDLMVEDVIGYPKDWAQDSCKAAGPSAGESPKYCAGAERHMFVPLENDLTTNSDSLENSWRHYIDVAKQAAYRADELGREMIELGLQKDLRREAAQEELAALCGSYSAAEEIEFSDYGTIQNPAKGTALRTCLDEEKHSLVFLTGMPPDDQITTDAIKQNLLLCGPPPDYNQGVGGSNPLCDKTQYDIASLDIVPWDDGVVESKGQCLKVAEIVGSNLTGFDGHGLAFAMMEPWFLDERLSVIAPATRVEVTGYGQWKLVSRGTKVMDSDPTSGLFPGCLRPGASACTETADRLIAMSKAFRLKDTTFKPSANCTIGAIQVVSSATNENYCLKVLGLSGEEDLGPGVYNDADLEAMAILWRVEGAVWYLGSLGGGVASNTFSAPIPVVDFSDADWGFSDVAPGHTVFGLGFLVPTAGGYFTNNTDDTERNAFDIATDIPDGFRWPDSAEIPPWIRAPYGQQPGKFKHVQASLSTPRRFNTPFSTADLMACVELVKGATCEHQFFGGINYSPITTTPSGMGWQDCMGLIGWMKGVPGGALGSVVNNSVESFDGTFWHYSFAPVGIFPNESTAVCPVSGSVSEMSHMVNIQRACGANFDTDGSFWSATAWPRETRLAMSVNSYPHGQSECAAVAEVSQTVTLACLLSETRASAWTPALPDIKTVDDMPGLEAWIRSEGQRATNILSRMYLEQMPKRVVEDIKSGSIGSGTKDGQHGVLVVELEPALLDIVNGWLSVRQALAALSAAVETARSSISILDLQQQSADAKLAISQLQITASIVAQASTIMSSMASLASGSPTGVYEGANAAAQIGFLAQQAELTAQIGEYEAQTHNAEVTRALIDLGKATQDGATQLQLSLNQVQSGTARALALAHQIRQTERDAQWAAAKITGEDFVVIDGKPVAIPVNAVYNRQYDIAKVRFRKALAEAKYLGYVARLAVEQRIGRRLETMNTSVGPIPAPSIWADDICGMAGLNYDELSEVEIRRLIDDIGIQQDQTLEYDNVASQVVVADLTKDAGLYVGDYLAKLENFVEYYNIKNPFHEGDDTAVLSLRDDVLAWNDACLVDSPNLLLYSHELEKGYGGVATDPSMPEIGWGRPACATGDTMCVEVLPGYVLGAPDGSTFAPIPPGGLGWSGATWLRNAAYDEVPLWAGPTSTTGGVAQKVDLREANGHYVLSWWDQARSQSVVGAFPAVDDPVVEYSVTVTGPTGALVFGKSFEPHRPTSTGEAAAGEFAFNEQSISIKAAGIHTVSFAPSNGLGEPGSVVIANVQLEKAASKGAPASSYQGTEATRMVLGRCTSLSPEELRSKFTWKCTSGECYYELDTPLSIGTAFLADPFQSPPGEMAQDNYNYRHMTVALNLVGTALLDCAQGGTASCYGNGIVRYTLEHDAKDVPVIWGYTGANPSTQEFDFGTGAIRRGQALALERYITLPVSSADASMLTQTGVEKTELMGRPLEGMYRLRIWDSPDLKWERLEDVQIILKYRYWSAVEASQ